MVQLFDLRRDLHIVIYGLIGPSASALALQQSNVASKDLFSYSNVFRGDRTILNDVLSQDVLQSVSCAAKHLFGRDIGSLKGKSTRRRPNQAVDDYVECLAQSNWR